MFTDIFFIISLILVISGVFILSKKTRIVYELLLVIVGMVLVMGLNAFDPGLSQYLKLNPETLLFGFLPLLLMEIAFTMPYKDLVRNIRPIGLLAVVSPIISTICIGFILKYTAGWMGYDIPILVTLLLGAIMSSTDPVTVLSIFRKMGAPRKLTQFFEGESLFNDGASLALFFLILSWLVGSKTHTTLFDELIVNIFGNSLIVESVTTLFSMIIGGVGLGIFSGILFSKMLLRIQKYSYLAILTILVSAYVSFVVTDLINISLFPASSVIATIFSTFIIGNYGRFKIDIETEELAHSFFAFTAFLINSLIFLYIGGSILQINLSLLMQFWFLVPLVVIVIIVSRGISVYLPIGFLGLTSKKHTVPLSWQHVLAWGSLRGGLALALVGFIPSEVTFQFAGNYISIKEFLGVLVTCAVIASIFLKTATLEVLIKKLWLNTLSFTEKIEEEEMKLIVITSMIRNIKKMHEQKYLTDHEFTYLNGIYGQRREGIFQRCTLLIKKAPKSFSAFSKITSLHALALERFYAKELFQHGDISEKPLKQFLAIIDEQIYRIRSGRSQIREIFQKTHDDRFERLEHFLARIINPDPNPLFTKFMMYRSRVMILEHALQDLRDLHQLAVELGKVVEYQKVEDLYTKFYRQAIEKRDAFYQENSERIGAWQEKILQKTLGKLEHTVVQDISKKELISERFSHILHVRDTDFESLLQDYSENIFGGAANK